MIKKKDKKLLSEFIALHNAKLKVKLEKKAILEQEKKIKKNKIATQIEKKKKDIVAIVEKTPSEIVQEKENEKIKFYDDLKNKLKEKSNLVSKKENQILNLEKQNNKLKNTKPVNIIEKTTRDEIEILKKENQILNLENQINSIELSTKSVNKEKKQIQILNKKNQILNLQNEIETLKEIKNKKIIKNENTKINKEILQKIIPIKKEKIITHLQKEKNNLNKINNLKFKNTRIEKEDLVYEDKIFKEETKLLKLQKQEINLDKIHEQKISKSFQYTYKSIVEEARIRGMKEFATTLVKLYEIYISLKKACFSKQANEVQDTISHLLYEFSHGKILQAEIIQLTSELSNHETVIHYKAKKIEKITKHLDMIYNLDLEKKIQAFVNITDIKEKKINQNFIFGYLKEIDFPLAPNHKTLPKNIYIKFNIFVKDYIDELKDNNESMVDLEKSFNKLNITLASLKAEQIELEEYFINSGKDLIPKAEKLIEHAKKILPKKKEFDGYKRKPIVAETKEIINPPLATLYKKNLKKRDQKSNLHSQKQIKFGPITKEKFNKKLAKKQKKLIKYD